MLNVFKATPRVSRLLPVLAIGLLWLVGSFPGLAGAGPVIKAGIPASAESVAPAHPASTAVALAAVQVRGFPFADLREQQSITPGAVARLDGDVFAARKTANLSDALRYVPGVLSISASGGSDGFLSIRGSNLDATDYDNDGVRMYQDGLPVTTADGNNHNRFPDPLAARQIIVARGNNALTYGASDIGGAIDVISRTARNSHPDRLLVQGGGHSAGVLRASIGGVSGRWDGMLTAGRKYFGGYREHSREQRVDVHANGGWQVSEDVSLRAFASWIDDREQLAGALTRVEYQHDPRQADASYAAGDHRRDVKSSRLALKGEWQIDDAQWMDFGISRERQDLFHPIVDVFVDVDGSGPMPPIDVYSLLIDTRQTTTGGMLRYHWNAGDHQWLAGVDLARTRNTGGNYDNHAGRRGDLQALVNKQARSRILFVVDHWAISPQWTLVYGGQGVWSQRQDRNLDDAGTAHPVARDRQDHYQAFNPRLGVIRDFRNDTQVYASAGRLYQPPDDFDLDNVRRERGPQATLAAMYGTSVEAGWRRDPAAFGQGLAWSWDLSAYYSRLHDEIVSVADPAHPGLALTANVGRTVHAGIEAHLATRLALGDGLWLAPRVSFSWNLFRFENDPHYGNNRLPAAPRLAVHGEWMVHRAGGWFAGPTFDWIGSRYVDYANTTCVPGFALMGLRAGIERRDWTAFVGVSNLFDRRHVGAVTVMDRAAADSRYIKPGAPRTVHLGVRWNF